MGAGFVGLVRCDDWAGWWWNQDERGEARLVAFVRRRSVGDVRDYVYKNCSCMVVRYHG